MKFFIRDCNESIVGNPAGYRTMKGADIQATSPKCKAWHQIREAYDKREREYIAAGVPTHEMRRNLCSIRLLEN